MALHLDMQEQTWGQDLPYGSGPCFRPATLVLHGTADT